jgi:hypothetical protein
LVVGVSEYRRTPAGGSPIDGRKDAAELSAALKGIGYSVTTLLDATAKRCGPQRWHSARSVAMGINHSFTSQDTAQSRSGQVMQRSTPSPSLPLALCRVPKTNTDSEPLLPSSRLLSTALCAQAGGSCLLTKGADLQSGLLRDEFCVSISTMLTLMTREDPLTYGSNINILDACQIPSSPQTWASTLIQTAIRVRPPSQ